MKTTKNQKRELILESTYDIFIEKGYDNTKMIDIARRAGIGKGTIYEYFDSKKSIFISLFDYFADEYKKNYEATMINYKNKSYYEQMKAFLTFEADAARFMCHKKKLPPNLFIQLELFKNPDLAKLFERFMEYRYHCLLEIVTEGMKCGEFRKSDPTMFTIGILGSIAFYNDFCNNRFPPHMLENIHVNNWDFKEFLALILNGVKEKDFL